MSFSKVSVVGSQANPDYVYYNATVVNNTVTTTLQGDDPVISFQDTRQGPVIKDSSQYDLAVSNFTLNGATKTLPVFIPQIQATVSTVLTVASGSGVSAPTYTQAANTATAPNTPLGTPVNIVSVSTGTGVTTFVLSGIPAGMTLGTAVYYSITAATGTGTKIPDAYALQVVGWDTASSSVYLDFNSSSYSPTAGNTGTFWLWTVGGTAPPTVETFPQQNGSSATPTSLKYYYTGTQPTGAVVGNKVTITGATVNSTVTGTFPYVNITNNMAVTTAAITAVDTAGSSFSVAYSGPAIQTYTTYTATFFTNILTTSTSVTYTSNGAAVKVGFYVSVKVPTATQFNTTNALVIATTSTSFTVANPLGLTSSSPVSYTYTYIDPTLVNNTVYSVTFAAFNGTANGKYISSTQFIVWEPENQTTYTVAPLTAYPTQQLNNDYYYCYTYNHWVRLINKALNNAWKDVTSSTGYAASSAGTAIMCPFVEFDETTGLFSISQDAQTSIVPIGSSPPAPYNVTAVSSSSSLPTGAYSLVGMNSNLEGLISNWENIYYGAGKTFKGATAANSYTNGTGAFATSTLATASGFICPLPEVVISNGMSGFDTVASGTPMTFQPVGVGCKSKPTIASYFITNPFTNGVTTSVMCRQTETNISTGSLWSPISSFVIGTVSIPVRMEEIANPVVIGSGNNGAESSVAGSFQKVLLETPINAVTADLWRGWVFYQPLVPTFSSLDPVHDGLTQMDFQVYWRNRLTNSLVPLRLYNTGTFNIRLLFRRKGVC